MIRSRARELLPCGEGPPLPRPVSRSRVRLSGPLGRRALRGLALEINQAGLSWLTMLQKREGFRRAFEGFDPEVVARYGERKYEQLLRDPGIIRNRLKIRAVIENARRILALRESHGSFGKWLDAHHPRSAKAWQKLFQETFVFTGGEIVKSFLLSTGYLRGAHVPSCVVYGRIEKKKPAWMRGPPPHPDPLPPTGGRGNL